MKLKDLVKQSGGSGSDLWNVPVELLDVNPGNIRLDGPALREHIAGLAESIMAQGFLRSRPLTIRQGDDRLIVVDGNCRLLAVKIAIEKGAPIKNLPCLSEAPNTSEADRTLNMLLANSGLQHTPVEYAAAINKLLSYGWTDTDIAKKLGRSRQWVTNTLETAALPPEAHALIAAGTASATTLRQAVRQGGTEAVGRIAQVAADTGRKHVTARHLRTVVIEAGPVTEVQAEPAPVVAAPEPDAIQDELVTLRQAVRAFLAAWDDPNSGRVNETVAALREAV
jgi:ParB family chromosome partitioning protein